MNTRFCEIVPLIQKLVSIESPYFHEKDVMHFVNEWLKELGLDSVIHSYHDGKATGFKGLNVFCSVDGGMTGPVIHLNGHLDTVMLCGGWTREPYAGVIEGDRLYGVGALDMKSGCAAMMVALKAFVETNPQFKGKIIFSLTSVEEGPYCLGANALIEDGLLDGVDVSLVAEPSASFVGRPFPSICLGARGGYGLTVELFGKATHAATPELGVSAAVDMARVVCALEEIDYAEDEHLGKSNACIIHMESDGGACSVPDYAKIGIFRHIVRGESKQTIIEEIENAIQRAQIKSSYKISFRPAPSDGSEGYMPYTVQEDDPYVQKLKETVYETTGKQPSITYFQSIGDFCYLGTRIGAPCILFGADGENFHSADEFVSVPSVLETSKVIYNYLCKVLGA